MEGNRNTLVLVAQPSPIVCQRSNGCCINWFRNVVNSTMGIGDRFDETGVLERAEGGFSLRCDRGDNVRLELHRVPVDHVQKRVRVVGSLLDEGVVDVEGVAAA